MFAKLFKPSPPALSGITTPTAELLPRMNASPEALALHKPGQSPGEYLQLLEKHQKPMEAVNLLAHGMPERDAVKWAAESSRMVGDKLNPADQQALAAADAWLACPTPENQAAAARAAAATNGSGPGGWTAQAVGWAASPDSTAQTASPTGGAAPGMTATAAAGAVMLAAGLIDKPAMPNTPRPGAGAPVDQSPIPAVAATSPTTSLAADPAPMSAPQLKPADAAAFTKKLKPFLDLGKQIASGVT